MGGRGGLGVHTNLRQEKAHPCCYQLRAFVLIVIPRPWKCKACLVHVHPKPVEHTRHGKRAGRSSSMYEVTRPLVSSIHSRPSTQGNTAWIPRSTM